MTISAVIELESYQDNDSSLKQLLRNLEYIPGTFPPVYLLGDFLIGYDKWGRLKILNPELEHNWPPQPSWLAWKLRAFWLFRR